MARKQQRDLLVFESSCHLPTCLPHAVKASHCPFNCWTSSRRAVNPNYYSLWFERARNQTRVYRFSNRLYQIHHSSFSEGKSMAQRNITPNNFNDALAKKREHWSFSQKGRTPSLVHQTSSSNWCIDLGHSKQLSILVIYLVTLNAESKNGHYFTRLIVWQPRTKIKLIQ